MGLYGAMDGSLRAQTFCLRQKSTAVRCGLFVQDCLQKHPELLGLSQPYSTGEDVNGKCRADAGLCHLQRNEVSAGGFWRRSAPTMGQESSDSWSEVTCVGQWGLSRGGVGLVMISACSCPSLWEQTP